MGFLGERLDGALQEIFIPLRRQKVALQWTCFIFKFSYTHLATGYFCEFRSYRNTRND